MKDTYTTKNGTELKLRAIDPIGLYSILSRMGIEQTSNREKITEQLARKNNEDRQQSLDAMNQLLSYCFTKGVETPSPYGASQDLSAMGFVSKNPNIIRLYWLRHLELDGQEEAGELVGLIIALSFDNVKKEKEDIAE